MRKKIIIILVILGAMGCGFYVYKNKSSSTTHKNGIETYHNSGYGYSLSYRSPELVTNEKDKAAVWFSDEDNYWILGVQVEQNSSSLNVWVDQQKATWKVESKTKVAGYDAMTLVPMALEGDAPHTKKTVFIKDKTLFVIDSRLIDHEDLIKSFQFEK